ncbi:hypothetical protein LCGC14_2192690, partial [marine sediment metagenome]
MARRNRPHLQDAAGRSALAEIGVTEADLVSLKEAPSQKAGEELLEVLKGKCKKGYRDMARKCHPDFTGEDRTSPRSKKFNRLTPIHQWFMEEKFIYTPPVKPRVSFGAKTGSPFFIYPDGGPGFDSRPNP